MTETLSTLRRETEAARALLASIADILDGDDALRDGAIDETDLRAAIAAGTKRVLELNGLMDGIAGMMASLKDRGERLERQRDLIREALAMAMEVAGERKIETPIATLTLKAVPPKVEVVNEADIPVRFWKTPAPKLDKRALLDALKDKESVPGAILSNGGVALQIRVG